MTAAQSANQPKLAGMNNLTARQTTVMIWVWRWVVELASKHSSEKAIYRSLVRHLGSVLMLAKSVNASIEVVIAAAINAVHQNCVRAFDKDVLSNKLSNYAKELIINVQDDTSDNWGPEYSERANRETSHFVMKVLDLIESLSEHRVTNDCSQEISWRERKNTYLRNIRENESSEVVLLSLITKLDGLLDAIANHAKGNPISQWSAGTLEENLWFHYELLGLYQERNMPNVMIEMFRHYLNLLAKGPRLEEGKSDHQPKLAQLSDPEARRLIVELWAWRWVVDLFVEDKTEASFNRFMLRHLGSVMTMAKSVAAPVEVVVAAALHDVMEDYLTMELDQTERMIEGKLRKYQRELVFSACSDAKSEWGSDEDGRGAAKQADKFVRRVLDFIDALTEPRKRPNSNGRVDWKIRKETYLRKIKQSDDKVILLSLITKLDGLFDAISILSKGQPLSAWSKGTLEQNLWFHHQLLNLYRARHMPEVLTIMFEHHLNLMAKSSTLMA